MESLWARVETIFAVESFTRGQEGRSCGQETSQEARGQELLDFQKCLMTSSPPERELGSDGFS
jgi:hypothetical protein